jgi:superfamily I DNA/RNA helicase
MPPTGTPNKATGAVEMLETVRIEQKVEAVVAEPAAPDPAPRLFAHLHERDFDRLGIPDTLLPALRRLADETALLDLVEPLPTLQQDVLLSLVDNTPDQVYADIVAPSAGTGPIESDNLARALQRPTNRAAYLVVTDAAELVDALAWPMDRWRIYLHPTQRFLAYPSRPYSGPARVTGGPGTGKTVVAVHRAKSLAEDLTGDERLLVTTFGTTLARSLQDLLRRLVGDRIFERVDVLTTDQLARRGLDQIGQRVNPINDDACLAALKIRLTQIGSDLDPQLVKDEWERVVIEQHLTTREHYLKAPRLGRAKPLPKAHKEAVWTAIEGFTAQLTADKMTTFPQITAAAAQLASANASKPYRHVIVDEAQDMTSVQWRLLRAVVAPAPDDLFIVGDAHQRIYPGTAVLSRLGIRTVGRSHRLTISYRTSREILRAGLALVKGHHYDDLDAGPDTLDGYRSLLHGPAPLVAGYPSLEAEVAALVKLLSAWQNAGVLWEEIAVGVRNKGLGAKVAAELVAAGVPATFVSGDPANASGGAHVMTLHRLKGLEYRCVAVAGLRDGTVPPAAALAAAGDDQPARRTVLGRERSLLFVACTRAREALSISWHQAPSHIIAPLIVDSHSVQVS